MCLDSVPGDRLNPRVVRHVHILAELWLPVLQTSWWYLVLSLFLMLMAECIWLFDFNYAVFRLILGSTWFLKSGLGLLFIWSVYPGPMFDCGCVAMIYVPLIMESFLLCVCDVCTGVPQRLPVSTPTWRRDGWNTIPGSAFRKTYRISSIQLRLEFIKVCRSEWNTVLLISGAKNYKVCFTSGFS